MDVTGIQQVVKNSKLIYPNEEKVRATNIGSMSAFEELLKKSQQDPASFWMMSQKILFGTNHGQKQLVVIYHHSVFLLMVSVIQALTCWIAILKMVLEIEQL